ncbi:MAG TPA: hypothetical protein VFG14_00780, partial [Chthoniobacteraceae bacterium]|nr:hypothetical protein [Chthoniobacteraceae bacterium]
DLDLMFIGDDSSGAADLMRSLSELTTEGRLYSVDARLRPEGKAGPLACPVAAFTDYFERGRGQLWEAQALTKSRPICGPAQAQWLEAAQSIWRKFGNRADTPAEISVMYERVVRGRSGGDDFRDFKTGSGGLVQVEFFTQSRQMTAGVWEPNTIAALERLGQYGVLPIQTARDLTDAYHRLRRVEAILRRMDDTAVSRLPNDEADLSRLACRAGFTTPGEFREYYEHARETIRTRAALA